MLKSMTMANLNSNGAERIANSPIPSEVSLFQRSNEGKRWPKSYSGNRAVPLYSTSITTPALH